MTTDNHRWLCPVPVHRRRFLSMTGHSIAGRAAEAVAAYLAWRPAEPSSHGTVVPGLCRKGQIRL